MFAVNRSDSDTHTHTHTHILKKNERENRENPEKKRNLF